MLQKRVPPEDANNTLFTGREGPGDGASRARFRTETTVLTTTAATTATIAETTAQFEQQQQQQQLQQLWLYVDFCCEACSFLADICEREVLLIAESRGL